MMTIGTVEFYPFQTILGSCFC